MTEKKAVGIVIDKKIREEAGRLGINISKVTENVLRKMIERMSEIGLDEIMSSQELPYCKERTGKDAILSKIAAKKKATEPEEVF
jgi:hypothetical protein